MIVVCAIQREQLRMFERTKYKRSSYVSQSVGQLVSLSQLPINQLRGDRVRPVGSLNSPQARRISSHCHRTSLVRNVGLRYKVLVSPSTQGMLPGLIRRA